MWRTARGGQTVQVSHDHHSCLPKVNSQVIILRQGQVPQKTLIWTQRGCEDLEITAEPVSLTVNQEKVKDTQNTQHTKQQTIIR